MFIIPILIALGFLAFLVLSLVLMGLHRAGKLKRFRHIHLFGAVVLVTVAAMSVAGFSVKYDLSHFVLTQPGTIWSTDDGSIVLEISDTPSGPADWYEYDMRMLVDGEYRETDEDYLTPRERLDDHWFALNAILTDCGMPQLDPRNATDWLVLYAVTAYEESMSERMEKVIEHIFADQ